MIETPTPSPYISALYPNSTAGFSVEATGIHKDFEEIWGSFTQSVSTQTIAQKFAILTATWKTDTKYFSHVRDVASHPSYLEIIAMGKKALPYIFEDLSRGPAPWFTALKAITRINPAPAEARGDITAITNSWLSWAQKNNYGA